FPRRLRRRAGHTATRCVFASLPRAEQGEIWRPALDWHGFSAPNTRGGSLEADPTGSHVRAKNSRGRRSLCDEWGKPDQETPATAADEADTDSPNDAGHVE